MEYITLLGAEDITRAGNNISSAAESFSRSVGYLDEILFRHQQFLNDFLEQLKEALREKV